MIKTVIIQAYGTLGKAVKRIAFRDFRNLEILGEACTIEEGIEMVKSRKPNLVLLDVDMPEETGFRVFEETREIEYEKVIVTENSGYLFKALRYQVADYLLKPLNRIELKIALERLRFSRKDYPIQRLYEESVLRPSSVRLANVLVRCSDGFRMVNVGLILRITGDDNGCRILLQGGETLTTSLSLQKLARLFACNDFVRLRDDLINLEHVTRMDYFDEKTLLHTDDGYRVEVPFRLEEWVKSRLDSVAGPSRLRRSF